jgi:DNA-binding MarR family transcriptional regulator
MSGPGPIGPLASPGFWLHRAALAYLRELDARLRPLDLTHTQFSVLAASSWLSREGEPPTQQQAAEFAGIDRMMTSKVVQTLQVSGLVERVTDAGDARLRRIRPTGRGRDVLRQATRAAQDVDASFFGSDPVLLASLAALVDQAASDG